MGRTEGWEGGVTLSGAATGGVEGGLETGSIIVGRLETGRWGAGWDGGEMTVWSGDEGVGSIAEVTGKLS
jgi:hypothetical protein